MRLHVLKNIICLLTFFFALSCSPSVEEDAKQAAKLSNASVQYAKDKNLEKSEKAFNEAKQIKDKYKDVSSEEFNEMYNAHLSATDK